MSEWPKVADAVIEAEDPGEGDGITDGYPVRGVVQSWYVYGLGDADAYPLLARWGHGPNVWNCACDECLCPCGESFHLHPWVTLAPGECWLGSCTSLHQEVVRHRLTREYQAKQQRRKPAG